MIEQQFRTAHCSVHLQNCTILNIALQRYFSNWSTQFVKISFTVNFALWGLSEVLRKRNESAAASKILPPRKSCRSSGSDISGSYFQQTVCQLADFWYNHLDRGELGNVFQQLAMHWNSCFHNFWRLYLDICNIFLVVLRSVDRQKDKSLESGRGIRWRKVDFNVVKIKTEK